ncbi:uncharacterized protein LOC134237297 [Saccostrea cucullata]|uniref:uncharacterized protein LOC134237297 n=1 Tax=Saccostrea cuccullata TaxID=36930 RepID=UPI002ED25ABF
MTSSGETNKLAEYQLQLIVAFRNPFLPRPEINPLVYIIVISSGHRSVIMKKYFVLLWMNLCIFQLGECQDEETMFISLNLTMSWKEGWTECQKRNGSIAGEEEVIQQLLSGGLPENEYWTGMHQYLSDWIGVVGWDYENTVRSVAQSTHKMDNPSPGACLELCQTHVFAITRGAVCLCIPDSAVNSNPIQFRKTQISVWTRCNNTETPNTCGGITNNQSIVSLYVDRTHLVVPGITGMNQLSIAQFDGNCLTARCDNENGNPVLQGRQCDIHTPFTCENPNSSGTGTWDQVYSYCLGVSSIYASTLSCPRFTLNPRSSATTYWIGYKRQFYSRQDTGLLVCM